jgi:MbtH protein
MRIDTPQDTHWLVLVNTEQQHTLWPLSRPVPAGWNEVGPEGPKDDCLAWVARQWTDMRPAQLR